MAKAGTRFRQVDEDLANTEEDKKEEKVEDKKEDEVAPPAPSVRTSVSTPRRPPPSMSTLTKKTSRSAKAATDPDPDVIEVDPSWQDEPSSNWT